MTVSPQASVRTVTAIVRLRFAIVAATVVATCAIWIIGGQWLGWLHKTAIDQAVQRAETQAAVVAAYVDQVLRSVDLALIGLDEEPGQDGIQLRINPQTTADWLRRAQAASQVLDGLGIIDVNGDVVSAGSARSGPLVNLADREYFHFHASDPSPRIRIGRPVVSRPDMRVRFSVTRRLNDSQGNFAGVIAGRIDPEFFSAFFAKTGMDLVALLLDDGTLIARRPAIDLLAAPPLPADSRLMRMARTTVRASYVATSPVDGKTRAVAVHRLPELGAIVSVGLDEQTFLAGWRREHDVVVAFLLLLTLTLGSVSYALRRRLDEHQRSAMADASAREAAESEAALARRRRQEAEAASRHASDFLAQMSHELRTPLNAIIGFAQMITGRMFGEIGNPRYEGYAQDILFSADHLLRVINNVLDLSRVKAGRWVMDDRPVAIGALLAQTMRLAQVDAGQRGVTVTIDVQPADVTVRGDDRSLLQASLNLLTNAIKYAGPDRAVSVTARLAPDGGLVIAVADRGRGMTRQDAARVLEPFGAGGDAMDRRPHDTGLGLPLARIFAEMHGGRIEIDSVLGRGTTVRLVLPPERVLPPAPDAAAAPIAVAV
ncbi:MAG: hypothetical protein OHK0024_07080 [Thalassobaculales bacterium]